MEVLHLTLLGNPQARLADKPLVFKTAKAEALLYYLAVTGQPQPRSSLVELLWGEMPEATARRNLTATLTSLRKPLAPYLLIEPDQIAFNPAAPHQLDVTLFLNRIAAGRDSGEAGSLQEAVELYQGDFLAGLYVKKALSFEEWVLTQRERLREMMIEALDRLVAEALNRREHPLGIERARRLLALEPWRESAHRQLMLLLARSGQREAALTQYDTCRQVLAEELGVEPVAETTALYERLQTTGRPPPHNLPLPPNVFVGRESELGQIAAHLANPDCRLLTIVGPGGIGKTRLALEAARRYTETDSLTDVAFTDGLFFVGLASLAEASSQPDPQMAHTLVSALGKALDISFQGPADLTTQLLNHLRPKRILLVLDNFEPLLRHSENAVSLVLNMLQTGPHIKLLVTSRERLKVQEEWVFAVDGLEYPSGGAGEQGSGGDGQSSTNYQLPIPKGHTVTNYQLPIPKGRDVTNYQSYSAIALFLQRAQQTRGNFTLSEETLPDVVQICRLVGGVPLALELAASWLAVLPCREIAGEIERSLDFLETSLRNMPPRHRSIRVVFEHSWRLLTPPEQTAFCRLAVFRGGFQREAAEQVAGASLPTLASLANKSLLRLTASGRYEIHELLRQFAAEKLTQRLIEQSDGPTFHTVWERHSHYFLRLIARHEAALHGSHPQQTAAELRLELDNIRQAWRWAVTNNDLADIEASLEALVTFYELSGFFQEGEEIFAAAVALFKRGAAPAGESRPDMICHLLIKQAWFTSLLGNYDQAKAILEEALHLTRQADCSPLRLAEAQAILGQALVFRGELNEAIAQLQPATTTYRQLDQPRQLAFTLAWLGEAYARTQMFDEALASLEEALQLDKQLGNKRGQAFDYGAMANVYDYRDLPETALTYQQNALALYEELAYPFGIGGILNNIGLAHYHLGRYPEALTALDRALQLFRQLSNDWDEANTLENLGAVYIALGDYEQAQQCLEQALDLFGGSKMGEAYVAYRLGQLYLEMGDYRQSRAYLQRAITLGEAMDDTKLAAACLGELGMIDQQENRLNQASAHYEQAISRLKAVGARFDTAKFTVQQARLLFEQGRFEQAQTFVADGIQLAQQAGHTQTVFEGRLLQAKITFAQGEPALAVQQVQELIATAADEAKQAALAYELWKMGQGEEHARLALIHYRQLAARSMNRLYRERLQELQAFEPKGP